MTSTSATMSALDEFINEIATTPFGEMRGPSVTAAGDHKRLAIERWENEGGAMAVTAAEACAKACDLCAAECEKIVNDDAMKAHAKLCRACAKACRDFVKAGV